MAYFSVREKGLAPRKNEIPETLQVMDLLEFCEDYVAQAIQGSYHSFYRHHHLSFNVDEGKAVFRSEINGVLARNGLAFEMDEDAPWCASVPPSSWRR